MKIICVIPARAESTRFFEKPLAGACDLTIKIFAPPESGENDLNAEDGLLNTYTVLEKLPRLRVRFEPVEI